MNKKKDFFEKLIISTIETLNKFKTTNSDLIALTRKPIIDNLWNHICFNLYGNINYINALNVFTMWQRDTLKYSTTIRNILRERSSLINENNSKTLIITIDYLNWKVLQAFIKNYNNRLKFAKEFDNFLAQKIQDLGIKCWLKCSFNWFSSYESRKQTPTWRGIYSCQEAECMNRFEATIFNKNILLDQHEESFKDILIFVKFIETSSHTEAVLKRISCRGKQREEQGLNLLAFKTTMVQSDNILNNKLKSNHNGK